MESLKKIGIFFALFLCLIGAGCGLGWTCYEHEWVAAFGVVVLIGFAIPTVVRLAKKLVE